MKLMLENSARPTHFPFAFQWPPVEETPVETFPAIDVTEFQDRFEIAADLPGFPKDSIKIAVEKDILTLTGERKRPELAEGVGCRFERGYGAFERSVRLPAGVDTMKIGAKLENGVLVLTLPKAEMARRREINIG